MVPTPMDHPPLDCLKLAYSELMAQPLADFLTLDYSKAIALTELELVDFLTLDYSKETAQTELRLAD